MEIHSELYSEVFRSLVSEDAVMLICIRVKVKRLFIQINVALIKRKHSFKVFIFSLGYIKGV